MKFAYMRYAIDPSPGFLNGILFRPMVPLCVSGPVGDISFLALLDTGADETLLPRSIADEIGIELDEDQTSSVGAFGGQLMQTVRGNVAFQLDEGGETFQWSVPVGFVAFDDPQKEIAILGHVGCLEFFRATFDGAAKEIELLPTRQFPGKISSLEAGAGP